MKKLLLSLLALVSLSASAAIIAPLPVTLQNGTTADANQVMSNFNAIVNNVNSNAAPLATSAQTNITNTFTSPQIVSNATALSHAVNAGQIQQNGLVFFADTGAANAYVATPAPAWASYVAGGHVYIKIGAGNTNTTASTLNLNALGAKSILNEDLSSTEANALLQNGVYHLIYDGTQFVIIGKNNTAPTPAAGDSSTKVATTAFAGALMPSGTVLDYAGFTVPGGFLLCDGSAVTRSSPNAGLFSALTLSTAATTTNTSANLTGIASTADINPGDAVTGTNIPANTIVIAIVSGTSVTMSAPATGSATNTMIFYPWGQGDGSTTFNVPNLLGKGRIGAGTAGAIVETVTSQVAAANAVPVATNNGKWITGMAVTLSNVGGFGGTIANGAAFIFRTSSNQVRFASTLALAQNATPDITVTGTGNVTITANLTARRLGEQFGEEAHAQSITELLAHTHLEQGAGTGAPNNQTHIQGATNLTTTVLSFDSTISTGGNVAANIMQPGVAMKAIIKQ